MDYEQPTITDLGSIADHTFQTPGRAGKDFRDCFPDPMFGEPSCPS